MYNTEVLNISAHSVETNKGQIYQGNNVVVCTGPFTMNSFDKDSEAVKQDVEYYTFGSDKGMPITFHEFLDNGGIFYGSRNG